jgi:hypothetical protein
VSRSHHHGQLLVVQSLFQSCFGSEGVHLAERGRSRRSNARVGILQSILRKFGGAWIFINDSENSHRCKALASALFL